MATRTFMLVPYFQTGRTRSPTAWCSHHPIVSVSQSLSFRSSFLSHNHLDWITITTTTKDLKAFDKDLLFSIIIIDINQDSTYFDYFILYKVRPQLLPASG